MHHQLLAFLLIVFLSQKANARVETPLEPPASSSQLTLEVESTNPSKRINDASLSLSVRGGAPPYQYRWSDPDTGLDSPVARELTEGLDYRVEVTDSHGSEVTRRLHVPATSITERFNSWVQPAVERLGTVLFWDPFEAAGLYDPTVYVSSKEIPIPGWTAASGSSYQLARWLSADGSRVEKGQKIAKISEENDRVIEVFSPATGTLQHLVLQGGNVFDPESSKDVIKQGAHHLARLEFDTAVPRLHANGTPVKKKIPFIVLWLILASLYFTLRLGFVNIRGFKHSIDLARGRYDDPQAEGKIRHFEAMTTAVSATVGLGNIAGVAVAISLGGAGATFWMFTAGFFAMSLKFAECTLGVKYRDVHEDGRIFGGPTHYLHYGLKKRGLEKLGKSLAVLFALLCVGASWGGGNMLQSNQAFEIVASQMPFLQGNGFWFGIGFAVLVGSVIIGGIDSIAKVTSKVVPFMALTYVAGCLVVIGNNVQNIGTAFAAILSGALSPDAMKGGFVGVLIVGLQRAAFSSESGVGSAAIAHSASKTNTPVADGFTALIEPFIDTMVVCTMTALVLIFTGMHEVDGMAGVELTSDAFGSVVSWLPKVLAAAVFLFAFSTMVSWSYYGLRSWTYLFGHSKRSELIYNSLFLIFVVLGASVSLGAVLDFSDMMILAMAVPNIIGLYIMSGEIRSDMKDYQKRLRAGELHEA